MTPIFEFEEFSAFGWKIHKKNISSGDIFYARMHETSNRKDIDNITYITKGKLQESLTETKIDHSLLHKPGDLSVELNDILYQGLYKYVAIGDVEWWCINYTLNRKQLPNVKSIKITAGESLTFTSGYLYACSGTAEAKILNTITSVTPSTQIAITSKTTIKAVENFYGLIFESIKA